MDLFWYRLCLIDISLTPLLAVMCDRDCMKMFEVGRGVEFYIWLFLKG